MNIHDAEIEKPPINKWVFAVNNYRYVGVAYWDGNNWRTINDELVEQQEKGFLESIFGSNQRPIYITHWMSQETKQIKDDQYYKDQGFVERICMRPKCNQPMWEREYIEHNEKNPLFCVTCWENILNTRDLICKKENIDTWSVRGREIETILKKAFLENDNEAINHLYFGKK